MLYFWILNAIKCCDCKTLHRLNLQYQEPITSDRLLAVLFISFCLRPLAPTRKLQNRNEFHPGKPNKRNRLFSLGSFESNILWNATYFRTRRLGSFISGSWFIAARIMSLQSFLFGALNKFSEKKISLLTAKVTQPSPEKTTCSLCLFTCAFVIAAFQLVNICH